MALNWIAGHRDPDKISELVPGTETEDQAAVYARISRALSDQLVEDGEVAIPSQEAALEEVLRGRGLYEPSGDINLAPFSKLADISLPSSVEGAPFLDDVAVGTSAYHYTREGSEERMVKPSEELDANPCDVVPFWDPVLRRKSEETCQRLQRPSATWPAPGG